MKQQYQILLILFLFGCSNNQKKNIHFDTSTTVNPTSVNNSFSKDKQNAKLNYQDTTFILRELKANYYHKVYIEKNRNSGYYGALMNFKFDKYELQEFTDYYNLLKQKSTPIQKFELKGLPKDWLPLYKYKNNYYLYVPSDWGNVGRRIITDSLLIHWYMDGPAPFILTSFKKVNQYKYVIKSKDYIRYYGNPDPKEDELDIYIIDKKTNLAVWNYKDEKIKEYRFQLYIPKENAKFYDIIVNYCDQEKVGEFIFDKIDFQKLIKSK